MAGISKFTPQEKVEIVLLGLKSPGSISELCRKYSINPNSYSGWKKNFVNGGMEVLKPGTKVKKDILDRENQKLKQIVGELYVKGTGRPDRTPEKPGRVQRLVQRIEGPFGPQLQSPRDVYYARS